MFSIAKLLLEKIPRIAPAGQRWLQIHLPLAQEIKPTPVRMAREERIIDQERDVSVIDGIK